MFRQQACLHRVAAWRQRRAWQERPRRAWQERPVTPFSRASSARPQKLKGVKLVESETVEEAVARVTAGERPLLCSCWLSARCCCAWLPRLARHSHRPLHLSCAGECAAYVSDSVIPSTSIGLPALDVPLVSGSGRGLLPSGRRLEPAAWGGRLGERLCKESSACLLAVPALSIHAGKPGPFWRRDQQGERRNRAGAAPGVRA